MSENMQTLVTVAIGRVAQKSPELLHSIMQ